jgi:hypothetical protein
MSKLRQLLKEARELEKREVEPERVEPESFPFEGIMSLSYEEFIKADLAVKIRSSLLDEVIFLVSNEEMADQVEADYVYYLPDEILALQGLKPKEIRKAHLVKKIFSGRIIGSEFR